MRSGHQTHRELSDEFVILGIKTGRYFSVEEVGAAIWRALQKPTTVAELCEQIVAKYNTSHVQCRADVIAFLEELRDEELISLIEK